MRTSRSGTFMAHRARFVRSRRAPRARSFDERRSSPVDGDNEIRQHVLHVDQSGASRHELVIASTRSSSPTERRSRHDIGEAVGTAASPVSIARRAPRSGETARSPASMPTSRGAHVLADELQRGILDDGRSASRPVKPVPQCTTRVVTRSRSVTPLNSPSRWCSSTSCSRTFPSSWGAPGCTCRRSTRASGSRGFRPSCRCRRR